MAKDTLRINYDEIKIYIRDLDFKKSLFGVKEDAVFASMQKLDEMYRAKIDMAASEYAALAEKAEKLEAELTELKAAHGEAVEKIASMEGLCADYEVKSEQMARMMADIQEMKDSLLDKAKADADKIMADAYEIQKEQTEKTRAEKESAKAFRRDNVTELKAIKQMFKEILRRTESAQDLVESNISQLEEKPAAANVLYLRDAGEN